MALPCLTVHRGPQGPAMEMIWFLYWLNRLPSVRGSLGPGADTSSVPQAVLSALGPWRPFCLAHCVFSGESLSLSGPLLCKMRQQEKMPGLRLLRTLREVWLRLAPVCFFLAAWSQTWYQISGSLCFCISKMG